MVISAGRGKKRLEARIGAALRIRGLWLATAESCTGGLLSKMITDIPGSSDYFLGGVIVYNDGIKKTLAGVKASTLKEYGAVSRPTALELAAGVRKRLRSDIGVSITGIAGPSGARPGKPVGTVYIGVSSSDKSVARKFLFKGNRASIRRQSAAEALRMAAAFIGIV